MKKIFTVVVVLCLLFSMCSCSLFYDYVNNAIGAFDVGYSNFTNKVFLADYNWDGSEDGMNIVTPDSYNGATITGLGGYCGRGVPSPFMISLSDEAKTQLCAEATEWYQASHTANVDATEVQYLRFQLHIGEHIKEIENLSMGGIILAGYEENGEEKYSVFVLTCYATCDDANKTFYANDGKLYHRKGNKLVEDIVYDDFDIDAHNEKNKNEAAWRSSF